ncbi:MAG TPA: hypothetical protein VK784_17975 [Pseudonocardiaceae bacterium]|nr:hypothetical protein [Pseudonocardiaceae bacterium]
MLLLDSQAALWILDDSPRLGPRARQTITSATAVHVSAATVWELTIKATLGKLVVPDKFTFRLAELRSAPRRPRPTKLDCNSSPPTASCSGSAATSSSTHRASHDSRCGS